MKKNIAINPFNIQFLVIAIILIIYSFGWSKISAPLQGTTLFFFGFVLASLLIFSKIYNTYFPMKKKPAKVYDEPVYIWIIIGLCSMMAEFLYEKAIPIVEILILRNSYNYTDFEGIPMFHVFAVTYTSFLGLWLWDNFLKNRKTSHLFFGIFFISYPIMLFNRGGFIFNIVSAGFVYFYHRGRIEVKASKVIAFILTILVFSYLFGVFGNYRSSGASSEPDAYEYKNSDFILNVGQATPEFRENSIPKEFFWVYLYASTPIANLQNIIAKTTPMYSMEAFITQSVLPDFLGKRIEVHRNINIPKDELISPVFNVSTYFSSAFKTMGYIGLILMLYYFAAFIFVLSYLFQRLDTLQGVAKGILFTVAIFSLFTNMITFSGLSFQLMYPILFGLYKKII